VGGDGGVRGLAPSGVWEWVPLGGWDALPVQARVVLLCPAVGPGARVVGWLGHRHLGGWVVAVGHWQLPQASGAQGTLAWTRACQDLVGPRASLPGLHLPGCLDPAPCLDLTLGLMDGEVKGQAPCEGVCHTAGHH